MQTPTEATRTQKKEQVMTKRLPIPIPLYLRLQLCPWARHLTQIAPHVAGRALHGKMPLIGGWVSV